MCLLVYVGMKKLVRSESLARVPGVFGVRAIHELEKVVRRYFSMPKVIGVGARDGCGCGFQIPEGATEETAEQSFAARRHLVEFLRAALELQSEIELFACWDGDQDKPVRFSRRVTLDDVQKTRQFEERVHLTIAMSLKRTGRKGSLRS